MYFLDDIHGVRWGKYVQGDLIIMSEHMGLEKLTEIKDTLYYVVDNNMHYYVYKSYVADDINDNTIYYTWLECERDVIALL